MDDTCRCRDELGCSGADTCTRDIIGEDSISRAGYMYVCVIAQTLDAISPICQRVNPNLSNESENQHICAKQRQLSE